MWTLETTSASQVFLRRYCISRVEVTPGLFQRGSSLTGKKQKEESERETADVQCDGPEKPRMPEFGDGQRRALI